MFETPIHLINQSELLLSCLQELALHKSISVDLEFDNNYNGYGVTLCLIQIATAQSVYVIDALAGLDLSGVYYILASQDIEKLMHASGEDLRLLHSLGCYPQNLYDTELAARLLNYERTSLNALLDEKLQVHLSKKQQRSNWLRRPLLEVQVQYAADDVRWLYSLKEVLEREVVERGLAEFVTEEQELLSTTIHPSVTNTEYLRPADRQRLSPKEQFIIEGLFRFRDKVAQSINRPAYLVMSDAMVRDMATGVFLPQSIIEASSIHPRFRNYQFAKRLATQVEQLHKEADSKSLSIRKEHLGKSRVGEAEFRTKNKGGKQVFIPIQQALRERFGSHAATFLLSNTMVNRLVSGEVTLNDIKPAYRQVLIRNLAALAGIDLSSFENKNTNVF